MNAMVEPDTAPLTLTLTLPTQPRVVSWRRRVALAVILFVAVAPLLAGASVAVVLSTSALAYLVGWETALTVALAVSAGALAAIWRWW